MGKNKGIVTPALKRRLRFLGTGKFCQLLALYGVLCAEYHTWSGSIFPSLAIRRLCPSSINQSFHLRDRNIARDREHNAEGNYR
ncbi:hypothetical protein RRG08_047402 [Elysia crispata]|uniref:Uncharacterized protein n=1 Tax=Elysia crispata TaxID=231223 RepID=A0AAE0YVE8_9GAST|nr:hypothetical protein RRG08_047402 [Elysia crispata]